MYNRKMRQQLGTHVILDFEGCFDDKFENCDEIRKAFHTAAEKAKCSIVNECFHKFNPLGISGVTIIEESHFALHFWTEYGYAAIDLFYCGKQVDIQKAIDHLTEFFSPTTVRVQTFNRGIM